MSLCPRCQNFDLHSFRKLNQFTRGILVKDIEEASTTGEGCAFCRLVRDTFQSDIEEAKIRHKDPRNLWIHLIARTGPQVDIEEAILKPDGSQGLGFCEFQVMLGARDKRVESRDVCKQKLRVSANSREIPDSDEHFAVVTRWLAICLEHPNCNSTISGVAIGSANVILPSRVIDVSPKTKEGVPRLHTTVEGERGSYTTLSHVWGKGGEIPQTTKEWIEKGNFELPTESLPTTFRDAIKITKELGIQYLWIDSLCIVQDDFENKQAELDRMSEIYQLSVVTIAAASASSASEGCFRKRETPANGTIVKMPYRDQNGHRNGSFYVYPRISGVRDEYKRFVKESKLLSRGWVFQERVLSRRLLVYTNHHIFFECLSSPPMNECGEIASPRSFHRIQSTLLSRSGISNPSFKINWTEKDKNLLRSEETPADIWFKSIQTYSNLELTQYSDRLAAISGVAQEVQLKIKSRGKNPPTDISYCKFFLQRKEDIPSITEPRPGGDDEGTREEITQMTSGIRNNGGSNDFGQMPTSEPTNVMDPKLKTKRLLLFSRSRSLLPGTRKAPETPIMANNKLNNLDKLYQLGVRSIVRPVHKAAFQIPKDDPIINSVLRQDFLVGTKFFGISVDSINGYVGWGVFERIPPPERFDNRSRSKVPAVVDNQPAMSDLECILISRREWKEVGLVFGSLIGNNQNVYDVLYLRKTGEIQTLDNGKAVEIYQRAGLGVIYNAKVFEPCNIYNMDETGFAVGETQSTRIIVDSTMKSNWKITAGNQEWITVLECINADGGALSPMIIFKAKNTNTGWIPQDTPSNWHFSTCNSGWTSNSHGFEWLRKVFEPESGKKSGHQPRLLIMDGHSSHITGDMIALCMENDIDLLILPSHCSHLLQPLDVGVYGPLKRFHAQEVDRYTRAGIKRIQRSHWVEIFKKRVLANLPLQAVEPPRTPQNSTLVGSLDLSVLRSSPPDGTELRHANSIFNSTMNAELTILRKEVKEYKEMLEIRKKRTKGKRIKLQGEFVFSTEEVLKIVREAELKSTEKRPRGRPRKRPIEEVEEEEEEEINPSNSESESEECVARRTRSSRVE
ncbi:hypothetical protein G7Y89_g14491 [Cudoniella acicularis]|uniref:Heterokaryon incompatibility domain-containing protein n=1 Tax=Cudoniella acicularis TaxID=354080 RepID=A0A8H4R2L2_9HELO|nr:hypothetical protein G7Y89_g14491 [Cudoniella acicularis]